MRIRFILTQQRLLAIIGVILALAIVALGIYYFAIYEEPTKMPPFAKFVSIVAIFVGIIIAAMLSFFVFLIISNIADGTITLFKPIVIDTGAKRDELERTKEEINKLISQERYEEAEELLRNKHKG